MLRAILLPLIVATPLSRHLATDIAAADGLIRRYAIGVYAKASVARWLADAIDVISCYMRRALLLSCDIVDGPAILLSVATGVAGRRHYIELALLSC